MFIFSNRKSSGFCVYLGALLAFFSPFAFALHASAQESSAVDALRAYDAGYDEWLKAISFKCTYQEQSGIAKSLEDALQGKLDKVGETTSGMMAKLGIMVRYSRVYDGGRIQIGENQYTHSSVEYLSKSDVRLDVDSDNKDIRLNAKALQDLSVLPYGAFDGSSSPLAIMGGGAVASPFKLLLKHPSFILKDAEVVPSSDDRVTVFAKYVLDRGESSLSLEVKMRNIPSQTLIESTIERSKEPQLKMTLTTHCQASDFRKCNGGLLPGTIVRAEQQTGDDGKQSEWRVRVWKSKDLGKKDATASDFVVNVPAKTVVNRISNFASQSSSKRQLDFNILSAESIPRDGEHILVIPESSGWHWKSVFAGLVFVGVVYVVWKRFRNQ